MTPGPPLEGEAKARFEVTMTTLAVKRLTAALWEFLTAAREERDRIAELAIVWGDGPYRSLPR